MGLEFQQSMFTASRRGAASAGAGNPELTFQPHAGSGERTGRKCVRLHTLKAQHSDDLLPARLYPVKFPQPPGTPFLVVV